MANKTRLELQTEVFARVGETAGFFTATQVNAWLVDGVNDVAKRLEPLIQPATTSTVVGQIEYALPTGAIAPHYVFVKHPDTDDWQPPLILTTYKALFEANATWEDNSGTTPTHWYWRDTVIGITPKPTDAVTNGLKMVCSFRPTAMSADADTTGMSENLDGVVVQYALYRAYAKDRNERSARMAWDEYLATLKVDGQKLHQTDKDTVPRMQPTQRFYRSYYGRGRGPRVILSGD